MNATLTPLERKHIRRTLASAKRADCVVLVGSVARGTRNTTTGDVDILVLNGTNSKVLMPGVQVTVISTKSLADRVLSGDDFAQWALRFGISIRGRSTWDALKARLLPQAPWPSPEAKKAHAAKRLARVRELLEMNDFQAAREELGFGASHLARAILLQHHVFPLSRPELPDQLRTIQREELADLLERLHADSDVDAIHLPLALAHLDSWLSERDLQSSTEQEQLKQAGRRLKLAREGYERFFAATPLNYADPKQHRKAEEERAQEEFETAKREFLDLYAEYLRNDPEFRAKSDAAERRLEEGPPWDDAFSPSELLKESRQPDR